MPAKKYQSPSGGLNAAGRRYFKRKTGARGLRSIMEELLMEPMYELPDENLEKIIIDENSVISNSDPIKLLKSSKNKSALNN